MRKMIALSLGLVLLGSAAAQAADARKPVQLTAKQMDNVTAGISIRLNRFAANLQVGVINQGSATNNVIGNISVGSSCGCG